VAILKLSFDKKSHKVSSSILFVCVQNASRSQMAEGFFRKYAPEGYEALSAGTVPTSEINPLAIAAMNEAGIDIIKQRPKDLTEDMMKEATKIVNMGCMDDKFCPTLFVPKVIDWGIEDPKGKSIEKIREIRDEIEKRVLEIVKEINRELAA
jgi:arsenate reductase